MLLIILDPLVLILGDVKTYSPTDPLLSRAEPSDRSKCATKLQRCNSSAAFTKLAFAAN